MSRRFTQETMPWGHSVLSGGATQGITGGHRRQLTIDALDLPLREAQGMPDRIRAAAGSGLLRAYTHKGHKYAAIRRAGYPFDDAVSAHFQGTRCGTLDGRWRNPAGQFYAADIEALLDTAVYLGST